VAKFDHWCPFLNSAVGANNELVCLAFFALSFGACLLNLRVLRTFLCEVAHVPCGTAAIVQASQPCRPPPASSPTARLLQAMFSSNAQGEALWPMVLYVVLLPATAMSGWFTIRQLPLPCSVPCCAVVTHAPCRTLFFATINTTLYECNEAPNYLLRYRGMFGNPFGRHGWRHNLLQFFQLTEVSSCMLLCVV